MSLLLTWSYRRIRHQFAFWFHFLRIFVDWTVVVYLVIPATALLIYEGCRYYSGGLFSGLSSRSVVFGSVTIAILTAVIALVFIVGLHFSTYGNLPFPMLIGDQVYVLLAPINQDSLFVTFYLETVIWTALYFIVLTVLLYPILLILDVSVSGWDLLIMLLAIYLSGTRIIGILIRQNESPKLMDWAMLQLIRIVLLLPLIWVIPSFFVSNGLLSQWFFCAATAIVTFVVWLLQRHVSWDPLFSNTPSRLVEMVLGGRKEVSRPTHVSRVFSMLFVRILNRLSLSFYKRPLHPVMWLLCLRMFRKKGLFWFYVRISVVVILGMRLVPSPFIRLIIVGFFLYLFYEYWKTSIAELYVVPMKEQFIVSSFTLEVVGSKLMFTAILLSGCLWITLGLL